MSFFPRLHWKWRVADHFSNHKKWEHVESLSYICCPFLPPSSYRSQHLVPSLTNLFLTLGLCWATIIWSLITGFTTSTFHSTSCQINVAVWAVWCPVCLLDQCGDLSIRLLLSFPCVQARTVPSIPNILLLSVPPYKSYIPSKLGSSLENGLSYPPGHWGSSLLRLHFSQIDFLGIDSECNRKHLSGLRFKPNASFVCLFVFVLKRYYTDTEFYHVSGIRKADILVTV